MVLIQLNTIEKIKRFMKVSDRLEYDLNLISGKYVVNGKSIMGIFGLDLSRPVEVKILNRSNYYPQELEEFIIAQR